MAAAVAGATAAALAATSILILSALCPTPASAWGGVFNRFSPEMLSNLGYGAHGANHRVAPFMQHYQAPDAYQELVNADSDPEEPCIGRKCTANEHCCPGNVCVYVEGSYGTCLFDYGSRQGEHCQRDNDCETGLQCTEVAGVAGRVCNPPNVSRKQYSEECMVSSECDIHKGLCCQFQRRHRQAPRKVCSYFKDPLICVGPVATDQVKLLGIEHTAGEKRLTGQAAGAPFNHIRK